MIFTSRSFRIYFLFIILLTVSLNLSQNATAQIAESEPIIVNQTDSLNIYYTYYLYDSNADGNDDAIVVDLTIEYDLAYENYFQAKVTAYLSIDYSISTSESKSIGTKSVGVGVINEVFDHPLTWNGDYDIRVTVWKGGYHEMDEYFSIFGISGVGDPNDEWVNVGYTYEIQDTDNRAGNDSIMVWMNVEYNTLAATYFSYSVAASPVVNPSINLEDSKDSG
ncbi:MAG: hypothetical protein ACXAC2_21460, partial [Candidatus Kariarchaeaceae archaeon]